MFELVSKFKPSGDQPQAIEKLIKGIEEGKKEQVLLGALEDIFNTGSNDIYVVKDKQGKQILLPAIQDVIKQIDIENKKIIVHLLPGLI